MKFVPKLLAALVGAVALSAPATRAQSIVDIADGDEQFSTLVAALGAAGLAETLAGDGTFTVFAPTNDAFAGVNVTKLLEPEWNAHLSSVLLYHVLGTKVMSADLTEVGQTAETLEGNSVTVTSLDPVKIDNATVIAADIEASNGVIHAVDSVLLPPSATETIVDLAVQNEDLFSTLVELVIAADLAEALSSEGPFTLFAPTNEAFAKLDPELVARLLADPGGMLTDVLLYHVVPGNVLAADVVDGSSATTLLGSDLMFEVNEDGTIEINDSSDVQVANILASNGVIHVIDEVLLSPFVDMPAPLEEDMEGASNGTMAEGTGNATMMEGDGDEFPEMEGEMEEEIEGEMEEEPLIESPGTIVDIAIDNADFSTLVELVIATNLTAALSGEGPFTLFAPTNSAFSDLDPEVLTSLLADPGGLLTDILLYHVVPGLVLAADLEDGSSATTLLGSDLIFEVNEDGTVEINDSSDVTIADMMASNGVIHVIDEVLLPPPQPAPADDMPSPAPAPLEGEMESAGNETMVEEEMEGETEEPAMEEGADSIVDIAVGNEDFSTLVELLSSAGLVEALSGDGPFTVFAPTNAAFSALGEETLAAVGNDTELLTSILLYHVVEGEVLSSDLVDGAMVVTLNGDNVTVSLDPVMINNANVITADIVGSNGVIHVIDTVLLPPADAEIEAPEMEGELEEEEMEGEMEDDDAEEGSIVDIAVGNADFSTLVELLAQANLVETLSGDGPFTVFAPTNAAFAALDEATLAAVGEDMDLLTNVLLYHVLDGEVLSSDLVDGAMVITLNGDNVTVSLDPVMINNANVLTADIVGTNGVIHVIDAVLLPPSGDEAPEMEEEVGEPVTSGGFQRIKSVDLEGPACIEIEHGVAVSGEKLRLGDCTTDMGGWSLEESGLFRAELDNDFCMQADFSNEIEAGTPIRLMPCDTDNELQKFTFAEGMGIRPMSDDDFCFSWRGDTANTNDPIIVKSCDDIPDTLDWKFE